MYSIIVTVQDPIFSDYSIWSQCVLFFFFFFFRFSGARKLEYGLKWVKWMDLSNRTLTRNYYSSNASKQRLIFIEQLISPVHLSYAYQLMLTSSIYLMHSANHFNLLWCPRKHLFSFLGHIFYLLRKGQEEPSLPFL